MQQPIAQMQPKAVGEWTTGLWGCFSDWGNCITTLFCPCITYGQVANIVDQGKTSCFNGGKTYALLLYFTCGCCLYSCFSRSKLRYMYNLPPSPFGCADCVVHTCCEPCALCQEYRELQNRGYNMAIGWDLNKTPGGTVVNAPASQMMNQMGIMSNQLSDGQNNRYDNQNDLQNDRYNNQNDRQNDRYNNQNQRQTNIPYNNQNDHQNDRYNNQNQRQTNIPYDNQNDHQNNRYNNQNERQNDHYDNQNDHQNDHQEQEY